jgi:hypothetical protein
MNNPLSLAKLTRKRYDKNLRRQIVEVLVEIEGVPKTWIPVELLVALVNLNLKNDRKTKIDYSTDAD